MKSSPICISDQSISQQQCSCQQEQYCEDNRTGQDPTFVQMQYVALPAVEDLAALPGVCRKGLQPSGVPCPVGREDARRLLEELMLRLPRCLKELWGGAIAGEETVSQQIKVRFHGEGETGYGSTLPLLAMRNLFRYGKLDYLDAFLHFLDSKRPCFFQDPMERVGCGRWINFGVEFNCLFFRRIAISLLREGRMAEDWPENLCLPLFDIERPNLPAVDQALIRVLPSAGIRGEVRLVVDESLILDCPEYEVGRALRRVRIPPRELLDLFRKDPNHYFLLVKIAQTDAVLTEWPTADLQRLGFALNATSERLQLAIENLTRLWLYYQDKCSLRKLNLHFPAERVRDKLQGWIRVQKCFATVIARLSDKRVSLPELRFRTCLERFSQDQSLQPDQLQLVTDWADRMLFRSTGRLEFEARRRGRCLNQLEDEIDAAFGTNYPSRYLPQRILLVQRVLYRVLATLPPFKQFPDVFKDSLEGRMETALSEAILTDVLRWQSKESPSPKGGRRSGEF